MSDDLPAAADANGDQQTSDKPKKSIYDYRSSTIEEDRAAALEVEHRVEEQSRAKDGKAGKVDAAAMTQEEREDGAARLLQGQYSTYQQRRSKEGRNLSSSDRWTEGMRAKKLSEAGKDQHAGVNDTASRWKRSEIYTQKISEGKSNKGPELTEDEEMKKFGRNDKERKKIKEEREASKQMEHQYWLEIVDDKHRYGTNLKWYHKAWNESDTDQNFFQWLDEGDGKHVDLEQCPRSRLEKEQISYLNAEQRQNYRVEVNDEGLLVWAKNGKAVNTTKYHRDAGPNEGIVECTEEEVQEREAKEKEKRKKIRDAGGDLSSSSSSDDGASSSDEEAIRGGIPEYKEKGGTKGNGKGVSQFKARMRYYASPRVVMDRALRESINRNTWLFVCDMNGNLYVGIKKTGGFQHSSFLYGARVTAAGLIKVDKGKLTSLSPLSGHYRAGTMHFKAFVRSLQERNVDMSSVSISKSVLTIRGIEKYGAVQKKRKAFVDKVKGVFTKGEVKTPEEEKLEKDESDKQMVKEKHAAAGDTSRRTEGDHDSEEREEVEQSGGQGNSRLSKPLPGDGKSVEEMTEQERDDRGVALVQRAFERGFHLD